MIDNLVEVGLLIGSGDHFEIRGWSHWNSSVNDVELISTGGVKGNHLRHHVERGKWGPTFDIRKDQKSRGLSVPESPTDRVPSRSVDVETD